MVFSSSSETLYLKGLHPQRGINTLHSSAFSYWLGTGGLRLVAGPGFLHESRNQLWSVWHQPPKAFWTYIYGDIAPNSLNFGHNSKRTGKMPLSVLYMDGDPVIKFTYFLSFTLCPSLSWKYLIFWHYQHTKCCLKKNSGIPHPCKLYEIMISLGVIYLYISSAKKGTSSINIWILTK